MVQAVQDVQIVKRIRNVHRRGAAVAEGSKFKSSRFKVCDPWPGTVQNVQVIQKVQRTWDIHRVLRRAQDVVSLPNYGGAENAERKKACVSVVKNDLGYLTAEALRTQRRKFSIKKYSELCVSVVKPSGIFTAEARRTRPSTKLRMRGYEEFRSW